MFLGINTKESLSKLDYPANMNNDLPAPTRDDLQGNGHASASAGDEIGSDSDSSISEESDSPQYYQPIPSAADEEELTAVSESESGSHHHPLSNGGVYAVSSSVSSLDLNESGEEEEEEEEEERMREEASNMAAIRRAFREDESRRSAPLPPENAVRVMEAMRGVTFPPQSTPLWAHRVPEDRWIHHLLTIRTPGCFNSNQ